MVEILHYELVPNPRNKTIGYADIKVQITKPTEFILRRIAHVQSGERKWFSYPSFAREALGAPHYYKFFEFENQDFNKHLLSSLAEPVKNFCRQKEISLGYEETKSIDEPLPF
jgi:hypothetical protein